MDKCKHYSYSRVSTNSQNNESQRLFLLEYANAHNFNYTSMLEVVISSRKSNKERDIEKLLATLSPGDHLYVYAIDRISRNVRELLNIINLLKEKQVNIHILKDNLHILVDDDNPMNIFLLQVLAMVSELERNTLSERTKTGMRVAREKGRLLGKPKGAISSKTIYEVHIPRIKELLALKLSYKKITDDLAVGSKSSLYSFVKHRKEIFKTVA